MSADIDPGSADFWSLSWAERYDAYRQLRESSPIAHFDEPKTMMGRGPGFYAITRHADIVEITRNPKVWSSAKGAFTVADEHRVGELDFVSAVAMPFPLRVMCSMMGIGDEHFDTIVEHTAIMTSGGDPQVLGDRDPIGSMLASGSAVAALVSELARERLADPKDDLITALARGEVDGDQLTPQEIGSFFILLVAAGSETTRTALTHGIIALHEFPDQKERWLADVEGLMPTAIDEIVRYASPVNFMRRTCMTETVVGGHTLRPGDKAIMYYSAANRDPAVFEEPDRLDLGRDPRDSLAYGAPGPHFCLGAHLARRELATMFRLLLTRVPSLELAGPPVQLRSDFLNGVLSLPVRVAANVR